MQEWRAAGCGPTASRQRADPGLRDTISSSEKARLSVTLVRTTLIQLSINGESRSIAAGANLTRLLDELSLAGKRLAVEKNGEIVPRSLYPETLLAEGDKLEIVVAVGGG